MGDIADMMLDGTLCEGCGVLLADGESYGFPGLCDGCADDRKDAGSVIRDTGLGFYQDVTPINQTQEFDVDFQSTHEKIPCKQCGKKVKRIGMDQHVQAVHGKAA